MECWASFLTVTFGTTRRQSCQLYAPAAPYPQGNSLVLTSVTDWVAPTGNRTRDLPSPVAVPQPTAVPLAPLRTSSPHKYAFTVCGGTVPRYYLVLKLHNTEQSHSHLTHSTLCFHYKANHSSLCRRHEAYDEVNVELHSHLISMLDAN